MKVCFITGLWVWVVWGEELVEGSDCTNLVSINKGDTLEPCVEEGLVAHGALTRLRQHLAHARVVSDRPPQVRPSETVGIKGLNASVNVANLFFQLVSTFLRCSLQKNLHFGLIHTEVLRFWSRSPCPLRVNCTNKISVVPNTEVQVQLNWAKSFTLDSGKDTSNSDFTIKVIPTIGPVCAGALLPLRWVCGTNSTRCTANWRKHSTFVKYLLDFSLEAKE